MAVKKQFIVLAVTVKDRQMEFMNYYEFNKIQATTNTHAYKDKQIKMLDSIDLSFALSRLCQGAIKHLHLHLNLHIAFVCV